MATKSKRIRDFKQEYLARIARGVASGKCRSQARGHARASDLPRREMPFPFEKESALEKALKMMRQGATQKQAARMVGVSAETLRRFQKQNTTSRRKGRRWVIVDERPVTVLMATRGKLRDVTVPHDAASDIGRHWVAINRFLESNDPSHLVFRLIHLDPALTMAMAFLARRCEARRGLALAVHVKGFGFGCDARSIRRSRLRVPRHCVKMPRRMRWRVISAKSRSTRLSHELDVGVKCSLKRLCRASQRFTFSVLCVA